MTNTETTRDSAAVAEPSRAKMNANAGCEEGEGKTCCVGVICVGGPTKGTRFRPLSMYVPKPLFPIGGRPMVEHAIRAICGLNDVLDGSLHHKSRHEKHSTGVVVKSVYLIGFFGSEVFTGFVKKLSEELGVKIKYLQEVEEKVSF